MNPINTPTRNQHHFCTRGVCSLAVLLTLSCTMISCASNSTHSYNNHTNMTSPAVAQAQARKAAMVASQTARNAAAAAQKGNVSQATKLRKQAIAQYRDALRISSEIPEAWNNLGVLLMEEQDYLAAADAFSFAMDQSPKDPRPCENLGLVYAKTGWSNDALKYYDLALERDPNRLPALRGAIKSAHLLGLGDAKDLARVKRALMLEKDDSWRAFFQREKLRIQGRLETKTSD